MSGSESLVSLAHLLSARAQVSPAHKDGSYLELLGHMLGFFFGAMSSAEEPRSMYNCPSIDSVATSTQRLRQIRGRQFMYILCFGAPT